ncbi:hypothetical protein S7711_01937 [Stachybotrys chartarum IBT 7711]|uniref:Uncharacterized protein n=1 Tax=Stachybotrys chartarum (strain CBS 109288 / IBT 7711) TaxID=1280523 RepID=A0A084AMW4_STACB|nr:hypothetical protein S7711_01937 [Stachybotrys chartarum IBT 7711]
MPGTEATARARANVPRPGRWQTLSGLDPYHRLLRETKDQPSLPFATRKGSFSVPRPSLSISGPSRQPLGGSPLTVQVGEEEAAAAAATRAASKSRWRMSDALGSWIARGAAAEDPAPVLDAKDLAESVASWRKEGIYDARLRWRPEYLRRRIVLSFAVLFAVLIVLVEILLDVSLSRNGVGSADGAARYLWQYGVTVLIVTVAGFWARVEYQAKVSAPWMRLAMGPAAAEDSILLDYTPMTRPEVMYKSVKSRDLLVASSTGVGMVLMILIVFAPALIAPTSVEVIRNDTSVNLNTVFVNDVNGLTNIGSLPYLTMLRLQTTNVGPPDGVTAQFASQTFRGPTGSATEVSALVQGFQGGMDCEPAKMGLNSVQRGQASVFRLGLNVTARQCTTFQAVDIDLANAAGREYLPLKVFAFQPGSCGLSSAPSDQRIVVVSATLMLDLDGVIETGNVTKPSPPPALKGSFTAAAALLCRPRYTITNVRAVRNRSRLVSVERAMIGNDQLLPGIQPANIAMAHFASFLNPPVPQTFIQLAAPFYQTQAVVFADDPFSAALVTRASAVGSPPPIQSLENTESLASIVQAYFSQYTALIAAQALMDQAPGPIPVLAVTTAVERRLMVREAVAHTMAALLAVCFAIAGFILSRAPRRPLLPRSPQSIASLAAMVAESRSLLDALRGMGGADMQALRHKLQGSAYSICLQEVHTAGNRPGPGFFRICGSSDTSKATPLTSADSAETWTQPPALTAPVRLLFILLLVGMIVGLEVALRASDRGIGFGLVTDGLDNYIHLLWTMIPVLFVLPVAIYLDSMDFFTRSLAPFGGLLRGASFNQSLGLKLMDCTKAVAFWRALHIGDATTAVASAAALASMLLAVGTAPLFVTAPVQARTTVSIPTRGLSDGSSGLSGTAIQCSSCGDAANIASLILNGNVTYPPFTYEDLTFPAITADGAGVTADDQTLGMTVSAMRPRLSCQVYTAQAMSTRMLPSSLTDDSGNNILVTIAGEPCRGPGDANMIINISPSSSNQTLREDALFGRATGRTNTGQCSDWMYVWGRLAGADTVSPSVDTIGAMACNETVESADTDVVYHGVGLKIDDAEVPVVDEATARPVEMALQPLRYDLPVGLAATDVLDPFFATLVSSRYAIDSQSLGSPSQASMTTIQDAIVKQHGIIRTQSLNYQLRSSPPLPESPSTGPTSATTTTKSRITSTVIGNLRDTRTVLRQDAIATRILQSVLGILLLKLLGSWLLSKPTLLPRPTTSIASVAAWLADGDILDYLGPNPAWQTLGEIEESFGEDWQGNRFQLQWDVAVQRTRSPWDDDGVPREQNLFGIRSEIMGA